MVDNSAETANYLASIVRDAGYIVSLANTLEEAKKILGRHDFGIAIIDMRLTGDSDSTDFSGISLALLAKIPSIILTSFQEVPASFVKSGRVTFFSKEEISTKLAIRVKEALDRAQEQSQEISIDTEAFQKKVDEVVKALLRIENLNTEHEEITDEIKKIRSLKNQLELQRQQQLDRKRITENMLDALVEGQNAVEERRSALGRLAPREQRELREQMRSRGLDLAFEDEDHED